MFRQALVLRTVVKKYKNQTVENLGWDDPYSQCNNNSNLQIELLPR